jgi:prolipoprotein diacylglyceryltransferase
VARHPTQLYESVFVVMLAGTLFWATRHRALPSGARFRLYFSGYFAFRLGVEFLKPRETPVLFLSAIQLASLTGLAVSLTSLRRLVALDRRPAKI